jgi:hypothetical protein
MNDFHIAAFSASEFAGKIVNTILTPKPELQYLDKKKAGPFLTLAPSGQDSSGMIGCNENSHMPGTKYPR